MGDIDTWGGGALGDAGGMQSWHAELSFAYTPTNILAWLRVWHILKGQQSAQADQEGLP